MPRQLASCNVGIFIIYFIITYVLKILLFVCTRNDRFIFDTFFIIAARFFITYFVSFYLFPRKETIMAQHNSDYGKREYWESRFEDEEHYEWLGSYEEMEPSIRKDLVGAISERASLKRKVDVLLVGCGNSNFSAKLAAHYPRTRITSIDFSETVIANMKKKYPDLDWKVMDMCNMHEFSNACFDIVIDKAACDALVTDEGDPWNPNPSTVKKVTRMMKEVRRVLRSGGRFLQISFQQAEGESPARPRVKF